MHLRHLESECFLSVSVVSAVSHLAVCSHGVFSVSLVSWEKGNWCEVHTGIGLEPVGAEPSTVGQLWP